MGRNKSNLSRTTILKCHLNVKLNYALIDVSRILFIFAIDIFAPLKTVALINMK